MKQLRATGKKLINPYAGPLRAFPWFSWLIQAAQVSADLYGYGLQLGTLMGSIADGFHGLIMAAAGQKVIIRGPPPSDPLGKAYRYLSQPAYHWTAGELFSTEDHWILLAADAVAYRLVTQDMSPQKLADRAPSILDAQPINFQPWNLDTLTVLGEQGWNQTHPTRPPLGPLPPNATIRQVIDTNTQAWPKLLNELRLDLPRTTSSTYFQYVLNETLEDIYTWSNNGQPVLTHIYTPEEFTAARWFEYQVFPPADAEPRMIERQLERALALAAARGREMPSRGDMIESMLEVFGTWQET